MKNIAPAFREFLCELPLESLDEMEQTLSSGNQKTVINKVIHYIRIERDRRLKTV